MQELEKRLLEKARAGDEQALGDLVESTRRPLFAYILRTIGRRDDAEDVFQEVWIRALNHLGTFRGDRFLSWLFRIAHNRMIDRARKREADQSLDDPDPAGQTLRERVPSPAATPAAEVDARDLGQQIIRAAETLPAEQREVFWLRVEQQMSFKEIAAVQGVSINTALGRMHYAMKNLRPLLQQAHEPPSRSGYES